MPVSSRHSCHIPLASWPSYILGSPGTFLPESPWLISTVNPTTRYLSISTFRLWSQRLALGLLKAGLQPGDRVLLYSGNTLSFPVVMMGTIMAGGVFTGANPSYGTRELGYQIRDSGARFVISAEGSLDVAVKAVEEVGLGRDRLFGFDDGEKTFSGMGSEVDGVKHWSCLIAGEEEGKKFVWEEFKDRETQRERIMCLNYSSGTTGMAKGVMITHLNYVANTEQWYHLVKVDPNYEQINASARFLCFLPMYHAMAQALFCGLAIKRGRPVYLMPKFDFLDMLRCLQDFKITNLVMVPPIAVAMLKHPKTREFDLSAVSDIGSGAAPLAGDVGEELCKLLPGKDLKLKQGWGMTEVTCMATSWYHDTPYNSSAVGELAPNCEAKIIDESGNEVSEGERGEFCVRAPNMMKGYWNKPEATAETIVNGWLHTGDIATMDKHGRVYIVDRKKELIKVKGLQVAPAELEGLLLENKDITDAAVVGATINGEECPRAYVVRSSGSRITEKDVADFIAKNAIRAKWLSGGVKFVEAVAKNPSGKILRKLLRDQAKEEVGDKDPPASRL